MPLSSATKIVLLIAAGSALGGVLRHFVGTWLGDVVHVPWRTFIINVTGSFVLGLFLHWAEAQPSGHPSLRAFIAIGLCGGYTTFSTFAYETVVLLETGAWGRAALYAGGSAVASILAVFGGFLVARGIA